jgi:hypothetical protein
MEPEITELRHCQEQAVARGRISNHSTRSGSHCAEPLARLSTQRRAGSWRWRGHCTCHRKDPHLRLSSETAENLRQNARALDARGPHSVYSTAAARPLVGSPSFQERAASLAASRAISAPDSAVARADGEPDCDGPVQGEVREKGTGTPTGTVRSRRASGNLGEGETSPVRFRLTATADNLRLERWARLACQP